MLPLGGDVSVSPPRGEAPSTGAARTWAPRWRGESKTTTAWTTDTSAGCARLAHVVSKMACHNIRLGGYP